MSLTLKVSFPLSQDSFTLNGATSLPRGSPLTEDYPRRADRAGTRVLAHFPPPHHHHYPTLGGVTAAR